MAGWAILVTMADSDSELLDAFPHHLADAVADELRHAGVAATVVDAGDVAEVHVPSGQRDPAWSTLAARMESITARADAAAGESRPSAQPAPVAWQPDGDDHEHRPLVTERLRGAGTLIALVLVPVLAVSLSRVRLPTTVVVAIVVGGAALLWMLRQRGLAARGDHPQ